MYPGHLVVDGMYASERTRDLIAEAAHARTITQVQTGRRIVPTFGDAVRWTVGVRVIRAGERLRGSSPTASGVAAITGSRTTA